MSEPTPEKSALFTIGELAERANVTRRTVRFYVQRGLLPAPEGRGRGSRYTETHLELLIRIRKLQEQNVALEEIPDHLAGRSSRKRAQLSPRAEAMPGTQPNLVWRYEIAPGLELCAATGRFDAARLASLVSEIQQRVDFLALGPA